MSLNANAKVYRRKIDAFSVVNQYAVPVRYSSARQQLTSGNAKLNAVIKLPREWQTQVLNIHLAADLLPQGRIESRYSLDVGLKKGVQRTIRGKDLRLVSTDYLETQVIRVEYN